MQCSPFLFLVAPVAALEILAESQQGSNTWAGLSTENKHLRGPGHHHSQYFNAQHTAHHSHLRVLNKQPNNKGEAEPDRVTLSIDFCTHWRLSQSTRAMCSDYIQHLCQKNSVHHHQGGLCTTYFLGESGKTTSETVGVPAGAPAGAPVGAPVGSPAGSPAGLSPEMLAAGWAGGLSNGKQEEHGMPEQGYSGRTVAHDDMETHTRDWMKEYGWHGSDSDAIRPKQTIKQVCAQFPENEWCQRNGYFSGEQEEEEEEEEVVNHEGRSPKWWEQVKREMKEELVDDPTEKVKKHQEKQREQVKQAVEKSQNSATD